MLKNKFILYFLIIPFFKPFSLKYLTVISFLDIAFDVCKIISISIIFILLIKYVVSSKKFSKGFLLIILYEITFLTSTVFNGGNLTRCCIQIITSIAFGGLIMMSVNRDFAACFNVLLRVVTILVYANFFLLVMYPDGLTKDSYFNTSYYFIADKNSSGVYILFFLLLILINSFVKYSKISFWTLFGLIIAVVTEIVMSSSSGLIACSVVVIFALLTKLKEIRKLGNIRLLVGIVIVIFLIIVVFRTTGIFDWFLMKFFGKGSDFSGRTVIWSEVIAKVKGKPIFGYGLPADGDVYIWGKYYNAHNMILEILLNGGLILLLCFISIIVFAVKNLTREKSIISYHISIALFAMLVDGLMESNAQSFILLSVLMLAMFARKIRIERKVSEGFG